MLRRRRSAAPLPRGGFLLPALGGLALALAFPPWRLWPLVLLAWTPLWWAIARELKVARLSLRRTFLQGWTMGFVAFGVMLYWLLGISNEEVTIPGLMIPGVALCAFYLGLFFAAAAVLTRLLARGSGWPIWLIAPGLTTLIEWLRSLGPLGFPWGAPAYALARVPPLLQLGALGGFWGLVLLVLLVNGALTAALTARSGGGRAAGWITALLLVALAWGHGTLVLGRHPAGQIAPDRQLLRVLVAQPDIRREIKWKPEMRAEVFRRVLTHARSAVGRAEAQGGYDLFVWPETVLPVLLLADPPAYGEVRRFVEESGHPVLLGTQEGHWETQQERRVWIGYNSALLLYPDGGQSPTYRKMRLVPFSERMPLQKLAPWLTQIDFGQSNFYPGDGPVLLPLGEQQLGCLICFESAFPEIARRCVRAGATVLVNITNDFWFGRTAGPEQHAEMAILRAVENRVPVVRCANTGISFVVDSWGRISHVTELFTQADYVATVAAGGGSFAAAHPGWVRLALGVGILLSLATAAARALRRRGDANHV